MGKFHQFLTEISACTHPYFYFQMIDNLSKYQWIFTKLGMCIDIVEIWFGIAYGQIMSTLADLSSHHMKMAGYYRFMFLFAVYIQFTVIYFNKMQWSYYGTIQTPRPVIQSMNIL